MNFVAAGRALLVFDRRMGEHLWFILTDADPITNLVVMVALVTAKSHTDPTVCLVVGDHPFVEHDSHVDYGTATFKPAARLNAHLANGRAKLHADMSPELLNRVRAGITASSRTPHEIVRYCAKRF